MKKENLLGVILLVHADLGRAEQVARHWARAGCPVVVHVDRAVPARAHDAFARRLRDAPAVSLSPRYRCEWGTWGIVAATLAAAEAMLARHPDVGHVLLASGACLPLRPVGALGAYLAARPTTDFIESATTADVPWTVGGLSEERFTLRFPFSWKRRRALFDGYVSLQRRLGMRRRVPPGLVPHMGSQWWCLTGGTLRAILGDPGRPAFDRYFRRVWIPDESYFQTLARRHEGQGPDGGSRIESRSLTLSKFDFQGKPHVFYDDHLQLLRRSDCFVARKIWPRAEGLYRAFLGEEEAGAAPARAVEPAPSKIDRVFAKAVERRTRGRAGLVMQSRHPNAGWENGVTAGPYSVFEGFAELFEGFEAWLARATGARVHGHLFAPGAARFAGGGDTFAGALSAAPRLRDHDPTAFLRNLLWNTRGERQAFQFGPGDHQGVGWPIACDPNAQVSVISGAWALPLFREGPGRLRGGARGEAGGLRAEAARLQRVEADHLAALRSTWAKARVRIWTLAEFVEAPMEALGAVVGEMGPGAIRGETRRARLAEAPRMADLAGFGRFLQDLKNQGMHPYLMGDFPADPPPPASGAAPGPARPARRPYLVRRGG